MTARFRIPADHPCLPGHFPGRPIVPGVVVLERVLAHIEATFGPLPAPALPQAKFLQPLLPEQEALIEVTAIEVAAIEGTAIAVAAPKPARWRFRVLRDGELLASGEVATP